MDSGGECTNSVLQWYELINDCVSMRGCICVGCVCVLCVVVFVFVHMCVRVLMCVHVCVLSGSSEVARFTFVYFQIQ